MSTPRFTPGYTKGNEGLKNRGVKKAPFVVLIGANMPSILAEISFVTNGRDASQLRQPEYRQRVAESLFNGVARYESGLAGTKARCPARARRSSSLDVRASGTPIADWGGLTRDAPVIVSS